MNKFLKGQVLFLIGALILFVPHWRISYNNWVQGQLIINYEEQFKMEDKTTLINELKEYNERVSPHQVQLNDPFHEDGYYSIANEKIPFQQGEIIGYIEIPKLMETLPIYIGATNDNLKKGVAVVESTSLPIGGLNTHSVLAGHRGYGYANIFRHIDDLEKGDIFQIHILGEVLTYTIYGKEIINPNQTEKLAIIPEQDIVTLLTCHPFLSNTSRLLVKAYRTDNKEEEDNYLIEQNIEQEDIFQKSENSSFSRIFKISVSRSFVQYHLFNRLMSYLGIGVIAINIIFIVKLHKKKSED